MLKTERASMQIKPGMLSDYTYTTLSAVNTRLVISSATTAATSTL